MPRIICATLAVVSLLFCVFPRGTEAETTDVPHHLIEELDRWLSAETGLSESRTKASVTFANLQDVAKPIKVLSVIGTRPRGLYDPESETITLVRPWDPDNPQDVSVLLHEMVHHRQQQTHYYCEAAKEFDAYRIQERWLREHGHELNVNWIGVVLASSCAPRDVHP